MASKVDQNAPVRCVDEAQLLCSEVEECESFGKGGDLLYFSRQARGVTGKSQPLGGSYESVTVFYLR